MEIITPKMIEDAMKRVAELIVKQSDNYKEHKNVTNFLNNVNILLNARNDFSEGLVPIMDFEKKTGRFEKQI